MADSCAPGYHTPDSRLNCSVCGLTNEQLIDEKISSMEKSSGRKPLPASVQVGPHRYRVTSDESERTYQSSQHRKANSWDLGGTSDHCRGVIHVGSGDPHEPGTWSHDYQAQVFLHEMLHAVWKQGCVHIPALSENEEQAICLLTPLLLDTLKRNPEVVTWLTEGASE